MMKNVTPLLVILCALASCEKDFIVPEQDAARRMVVNSFFTDVQPMQVYVTESYTSSGSNSIQSLNDAQVQLFEDGVLKENLDYTPSDTAGLFGSYKSALIPQKGKKYSITTIHQRYGTATAEDEMPLPVEVVAQQMLQYPDTVNQLQNAMVQFKLQDDGSKENFYRLNVWTQGVTRYVNFEGDTIEREEFMGLRAFPVTSLEDTVRESGWFLLYSDKGFNGLEKDVQLNFSAYPSDYFVSLKIWVEVQTISKSYFEYHRTLELDRRNNNSATPVSVYNNIHNGYGIFAGGSVQYLQFLVK